MCIFKKEKGPMNLTSDLNSFFITRIFNVYEASLIEVGSSSQYIAEELNTISVGSNSKMSNFEPIKLG